MLRFLLHYWTPIVSTVSFFMSVYLVILHWIQSTTRISFDEIKRFDISDFENIILLTITNKSNNPISITNAKFGSNKLIRANHRRFLEDNFFAHTSVFPINIKPHETVEVLMEFELTFIELNNEEKQKLILITSKKKVSKVISKLESKTTPSQLAKLTSKVRKEPF